MIPYSQYNKHTIDAVKSGDTSCFPGDDKTIRNWLKK